MQPITETKSAVKVDSTPRITLFIAYLVIPLLFAGREFKGATRLPNTQTKCNMATNNLWNRKDEPMLMKSDTDETPESTPAVVVVSKQQPSTATQKTKTHRVLMVFSQWSEQATLRTLDVEATGIREAKALASDLLRRLEPGQLEAVTVDPHDLGYDFSDPEILDVWKTRDIPGHAWTRAEIESEDFDALVNQAVAELGTCDGQPVLEEVSR